MTKTYTYTRELEVNFDDIIEEYDLKERKNLKTCKEMVRDLIGGLDDEIYYLIDNVDEIARDLYNYLKEKYNAKIKRKI